MVCDVALQLTHTIRRFFSSKDVLLFCSTFSLTTLWVRISAKVQPMLGSPLPVEPSHGLLTEVQPPVLGIRACPKL